MSPSILLIAPPGDVAVAALAGLLRHRGVGRVTVVDDRELARHPVTLNPESGPCAVESALDPPGYDVIWCRAMTLGARPFARPSDDDYAAAEMHAVGMSWLWSRREVVVNRPTPSALCGTVPDPLRVAVACTAVGLSTPDLLLATDAARVPPGRWPGGRRRSWPEGGAPRHLDGFPPAAGGPPLAEPAVGLPDIAPGRWDTLVCGSEVDAPTELHDPLRALVRSLDLEVAAVRLAPPAAGADRPQVLGVDPVPSSALPTHLLMLARYLEQRATEHEGRRAA